MKHLLMGLLALSVPLLCWSDGFSGVLDAVPRTKGNFISVSGREYPLSEAVSARYQRRSIAIEEIPPGTQIHFTLEQTGGVSAVGFIEIEGTSDTLDAIFPPS
jgi:hypothetical protein